MKEKVFIDSNIFLYALLNEKEENKKCQGAIELFDSLDGNDILISTQVINEIFVNLLKNRIAKSNARKALDSIIADCEVMPIELETVRFAWNLRDNYNFSYWDSLIVSSALLGKCSYLYTEDMQDNLKVENRLKIINPFLSQKQGGKVE
ncbi:MAG: PIN domain-containing protein [Leptospiraceae bacterium]|nr:PIN domain-containing protein [Leptospiraceae bacterium]MCP5500806.1 PIN domain-containing protein [Leptospiraceae bacterium]